MLSPRLFVFLKCIASMNVLLYILLYVLLYLCVVYLPCMLCIFAVCSDMRVRTEIIKCDTNNVCRRASRILQFSLFILAAKFWISPKPLTYKYKMLPTEVDRFSKIGNPRMIILTNTWEFFFLLLSGPSTIVFATHPGFGISSSLLIVHLVFRDIVLYI